MSGQKAFFLTGANAKIKINHRTVAFCTNIAYSVNVNHIAPILLGMYEACSIEPVSYMVSGSFTIIRYTAGMQESIGRASPPDVSKLGNGIGAWGPSGIKDRIKGGLSFGATDGRAYDALNPIKLETATGFDIEIHQKYDKNNDSHPVAKIRDCRITGSNFNLANKTSATQNFTFRALYVDEDSFLSDFSGLGQQFI